MAIICKDFLICNSNEKKKLHISSGPHEYIYKYCLGVIIYRSFNCLRKKLKPNYRCVDDEVSCAQMKRSQFEGTFVNILVGSDVVNKMLVIVAKLYTFQAIVECVFE